jgi:hypothetical protein
MKSIRFGVVLVALACLMAAPAQAVSDSDTSGSSVTFLTWSPPVTSLVAVDAAASCEGLLCTTCESHWIWSEHQHGYGGEDFDNAPGHPNGTWLPYDCDVNHTQCGVT